MDTFSLSHYAPDGELLGSANFSIDQLSPRWLAVCGDLLDACGPVFLAQWAAPFSASQ